MDKFRIDAANQYPAILDLLVQILANQHAVITAMLVEFADRNKLDAGELAKRLEKSRAEYAAEFREYILDNFGHLDVDDLTQ